VEALQAPRGVQPINAATIIVELGNLRRFDNPRQLMGYLGLVPGETSTGDTAGRMRLLASMT
jgi:transposase